MANPEHLAILEKGFEVWNKWRAENPDIRPDLSERDFKDTLLFLADLSGADLSRAKLKEAHLSGADLSRANLKGANLSGAYLGISLLSGVNLGEVDLDAANLEEANLEGANLSRANLSGVNLNEANLSGTNFEKADLSGADLSIADLSRSKLKDANLSGADLSRANLKEADLSGASLFRINLNGANLSIANLSGTNFEEADLSGADLSGTNFEGADLSGADLEDANLEGANLEGGSLSKANLSGVNLKEANLKDANLSKANLDRANLRGLDLKEFDMTKQHLSEANLTNTDLRKISLISAVLDGANLTGAMLWETQRSGWSIKGVICEYAYFDRDGVEKIDFKPGEFERLYSEQTKIVLHYADGMTQFEVTTLPALIQFIESRHPGSSLRLRTIGEDAGGASVTVAVDELGDVELSVLREDFEKYKEQIRQEVQRDTQMEVMVLKGQVSLLTGIIEKKMGDTFNIQQVTGVVKAESSTVKQTISTNDLSAVSKLISDIFTARPEIEKLLPAQKVGEFNAAFEIMQEQASAPHKNWEKVKQAAQSIKNVLMSTGDLAGKWIPIVEKLSEAVHGVGMV